jgi:hypothetical protein
MKRILLIVVPTIIAVGIPLGAWDDAANRSPRFALAVEPAEREFIGPAVAAHEAERGDRYQATPTAPPPTVPTDGDCNSWLPLLAKYGITDTATAIAVMTRESRCSNAHNHNSSTRDHSHGPFQVNIYGSLAAAWANLGFSHDYLHTPEGAVAAAGVLYRSCGWGPWTKPYSCPGGWPL